MLRTLHETIGIAVMMSAYVACQPAADPAAIEKTEIDVAKCQTQAAQTFIACEAGDCNAAARKAYLDCKIDAGGAP